MLPPPQTKEFYDRVLTLESDCRTELESSVQSLSEISLLLSKTSSEVEKLANRELQMSNRVRDMEMHLDNYSREDIRDLYNTAHETQLRLFMMRSQAEQLQTRQQHVRDYQEKLRLLIDLLGIQAVPQEDANSSSIPRGATGMLGATEILAPVSALSIIEAQEDERLRIAREINDGATQALTNLMLRAEICSRLIDRDVNETRTELESLKVMINTSLQESRRLVYDLRPLAIEEAGVVTVLRAYMEELKRAHGIEGSVDGPEVVDVNTPMQLAIFRFVQAILGALLVEGGAYQLDVHLGLDGQIARVLVEGIGLESERETIYAALDEETMRHRIDHFGATLTTQTRSNRGMAIEIDIPVPMEAMTAV
ncbi:MAG TPA: histidine kinase [Thermomicrobiales bacterium]|nr:histidine kinase [Thermomicrobiales bacterium]